MMSKGWMDIGWDVTGKFFLLFEFGGIKTAHVEKTGFLGQSMIME